MQIQEVAIESKVEIKRRWQRQATCGCQYYYVNDVFWILVFGNVANVRCSVLSGKSADMPEDIIVDWSLRFPRSVTATGTPKAVFSVDDKCIAVCGYLCSRLHIYTTKIDGVVCPPNISETVAGRLMKLAHRPRIASTMIKLISKPNYRRHLIRPTPFPVSVTRVRAKCCRYSTVLCDYSVWVIETGAPGSGKTIQPIRI